MPKEPPGAQAPRARPIRAHAGREGGSLGDDAAGASDTGAYGFPGSVALGEGRVFASSLDGKLYAFTP